MAIQRVVESRTRRKVLQALGVLAAGGAISSLESARGLGQGGSVPAGIRFGVQLNAFPIDPKRFETFTAALEQVKQIGYQGFEAGFRFLSEQFAAPEMAHRSIEQTGLTFFGIHIFFPNDLYD
jgi:inosose dehydratase